MAKRNRMSLRGEDGWRRRAGSQTDKGKTHEGMEEKKRNRQRMSNGGGDKVMMAFRASVTGLTRDST